MGFLDFLKGGPSFRSTIDADPIAGALIKSVRGCDFRPAMAAYAANPNDTEVRRAILEVTANNLPQAGADALLDAWVKNTPTDAFARLVRGTYWLNTIPSWGPGDDAGRAQAALHEQRANEDLNFAAKLAPYDAVPWVILSRMNLSLGEDGVERAFEEGVARDPHCVSLHFNHQHSRSAMWYGSMEEALDLAHSVASSTPDGGIQHMLVVTAHIRNASYLQYHADDEEKAPTVKTLRKPEVRQAVLNAVARSIHSPVYQRGPRHFWAHHYHAAYHYFAEDYPACREALNATELTFDENLAPWYCDVSEFRRVRKIAGVA